ncbi:MAG: hypothetical protein OJF51_002728 [Nitrospira sp.]|jgi:hypothetical protein|nr:MAG: hypothetical protein OJF51_002728 [Nitrospira sp.]
MSPWILDESIGCEAVAQLHESMPKFYLPPVHVVFHQPYQTATTETFRSVSDNVASLSIAHSMTGNDNTLPCPPAHTVSSIAVIR